MRFTISQSVSNQTKFTRTLLLTITFWLALGFLIYTSQMLPMNISSAQTTTTSPTTTKFVDYDGSKYGFHVQYPANWNLTQDQVGIWFVSPVDSTGNIRIERQPALNQSLSDLVNVQLLQAKDSYKDLKVISSNLTTLGGNPANRTDYQFKIEEPRFMGVDTFDFKAIQISTINNNNLYTFTYFSNPEHYDIFLPIAQKMISSLKIQ